MQQKLQILKENETGHGILIENDAGFVDRDRSSDFIQTLQKPLLKENGTLDFEAPITCILQKYDIRNKNGRIYPERVLRREAQKYMEKIRLGEATGELNHPDITELDGDRLSHRITKIWFEGNTLVGELKLILSKAFRETGAVYTKGDLVATYMAEGVRVGVSSRGVGSVKLIEGTNMVQEDFELICWDVVMQPSTPNAWLFNQPEERKQFVESNPKIITNINNFLKG